ncbi:septal ring lytic transglycosylase RlpA family protein [Fulvivirga sedimenti]|uniref:Probable endolytic peptidoglycan transglycosylase RlpA n=1 Tax=Fulvivirga sedimenti TaxID=2879465 RepID=A0A9X1HWX9_9BACT|nr:septal ring lytic transglycosylase RlpA family protein [Fulvivirga sedimenti]MCA6078282.1 septal ring lytic transglycosylase RlpA family protein [Fulvivirga sedimenti]
MKLIKACLFVSCWLFIAPLMAQTYEGKASFYADKFEGRPTASGEKYRAREFTAAHRTLPFGTVVRVTNLENKREVIVTINDRGPFVKSRIIDLSKAAAQSLDFILQGVADVRVEILETGELDYFLDVSGNPLSPKGWYIQLASFSEKGNALVFARDISKAHGTSVFLEQKTVENIPRYRVHAGPYESRNAAEQTMKLLQASFSGIMLKEQLSGSQ